MLKLAGVALSAIAVMACSTPELPTMSRNSPQSSPQTTPADPPRRSADISLDARGHAVAALQTSD